MPRAICLSSIAEIRAAAPQWDDLWQRSDATSPLARAEPVAQWLEHFAPTARFRTMVIEERGRWLAALPLVDRRMAGVLRAAAQPCNAWPSGATLLWDVDAANDDVVGEAVGDTMAAAIGRLPWQILFLEAAFPDRPSWQALYRAASRSGMACDLRTRWLTSRLEISHDWPTAFARLSGRHRQKVARSLRNLGSQTEVRFELHTRLADDDLEPILRRAFEVELRGWKGQSGSAALRSPEAFAFLLRQAHDLAAEGSLAIALLGCGEQDVAFCYGVVGKGVFHSFKIGYDSAFAAHSPGHLLQYHLLQAFHADTEIRTVDYIGPMTEYHSHWRPTAFPFARLAIAASQNLLGRAALWSFQQVRGPSELLPTSRL